MTDMGELMVGAYLRYVRGCDVVLYNHRVGKDGEIDVIGLQVGETPSIWICEVATHMNGVVLATYGKQGSKFEMKLARAVEFANEMFPSYEPRFEFWSPLVRKGHMANWVHAFEEKHKAAGLDVRFVTNDEYAQCFQDLIEAASQTKSHTSDPAFRMLQILTHVTQPLDLTVGRKRTNAGPRDRSQPTLLTPYSKVGPLPKGRFMLASAKALIDAGVDPRRVQEALPPRFLVGVDGHHSGDKLWSALEQTHGLTDAARWFSDDPIHTSTQTWVLSNQWTADRVASSVGPLFALAPEGYGFDLGDQPIA